MGNCIQSHKTITINTIPTFHQPSSSSLLSPKEKTKEISLASSISQKSWLHVIDYLKFDELKEVGKINRQFNISSRSYLILTKFFKKKREDKADTPQLGNETTFASEKRNSIGSFGRGWN